MGAPATSSSFAPPSVRICCIAPRMFCSCERLIVSFVTVSSRRWRSSTFTPSSCTSTFPWRHIRMEPSGTETTPRRTEMSSIVNGRSTPGARPSNRSEICAASKHAFSARRPPSFHTHVPSATYCRIRRPTMASSICGGAQRVWWRLMMARRRGSRRERSALRFSAEMSRRARASRSQPIAQVLLQKQACIVPPDSKTPLKHHAVTADRPLRVELLRRQAPHVQQAKGGSHALRLLRGRRVRRQQDVRKAGRRRPPPASGANRRRPPGRLRRPCRQGDEGVSAPPRRLASAPMTALRVQGATAPPRSARNPRSCPPMYVCVCSCRAVL